MTFELTSSAFEPSGLIPRKYTGEGADQSPPLDWSGAPSETKANALIVEDPDAPNRTFTHWVLFDIPVTEQHLPEGLSHRGRFTDGRVQGDNDFDRRGWNGPMPPKGHGPHRYVFTLYALDTPLGLDAGARKGEVRRAMEGHVLASTELIGRYERGGNAS